MKYIGKFRNIQDKLYTIEIISDNDSSSVKELTLTDEPFLVTENGNDENIYEPLHPSEAAINIITSTPYFDMYSAVAKGTSVKLFDESNKVKWTGYVEPMMFNQQWESDADALEINCLDGISILQYIKYEAKTKELLTFVQIFNKIFSASACYTHFYLPTSLTINDDKNIINEFSVSEHNFFDEDDEPMTCQEVLEEICRWLNFTVTAEGDEVFLIDPTALKNGYNEYYKYTVGSNDYTPVTITSQHDITAESYAENGAQISLSSVYNKVTVKSDLYPITSIMPSFWENIENQHGKGAIEEVKTPYSGRYAKHHISYFQYFKNKNYKSIYYPISGNLENELTLKVDWTQHYKDNITYLDLRSTVGASIVKHACYNYDKDDEDKNKINLDNQVVFHIHDKFPPTPLPIFEAQLDKVSVFPPSNSYLVLSGNATFLDDVDKVRNGISEIIKVDDQQRKKDNFHAERLNIMTRLEINGNYWNGTEWQTTPCGFPLIFADDDNNNDHFIGKSFPVKNNISWKDNINEKGYKIKLPLNARDITPKITFYAPTQRIDDSYRLDAIWLSDFDIKVAVANLENTDLVLDDEKTDTEYSNVIDDSYVKEMDEITFKVCTYDNKTMNYSSVIANNKYVDEVKHVIFPYPNRQEVNLIDKLVRQYLFANIILDVNLANDYTCYTTFTTHFFPNKIFIIDSKEVDYANNKVSLHLVEKN